MPCRQCQGLETFFDTKIASRELKRYHKRGPRKTTRLLIDALCGHDIQGGVLLDIGGGIGAIQFNVRYDYLDLSDAGVTGGTQNLFGASLIWTPIDHARFSINYGHVSYDDATPILLDTSYSTDVVGMRAEVDF